MRIILDIDRVRDPKRSTKRKFRIRTRYYFCEKDGVRDMNAGVEIYGVLCEMLDRATADAIMIHEGQRQ